MLKHKILYIKEWVYSHTHTHACEGGHARVLALAAIPEMRRRGYGRSLLLETERLMLQAGVPRLLLSFSDRRDQPPDSKAAVEAPR